MGYIKARVWHHLGSPHNMVGSEGAGKEQGFPMHHWAGRLGTEGFGEGTVLVTAAAVHPADCTRMLEGFAIWQLKRSTNNECLNIAD